jgi:hypothetical protein
VAGFAATIVRAGDGGALLPRALLARPSLPTIRRPPEDVTRTTSVRRD